MRFTPFGAFVFIEALISQGQWPPRKCMCGTHPLSIYCCQRIQVMTWALWPGYPQTWIIRVPPCDIYLPPANREVCEGYVFTPVCQSFYSQGGLLPGGCLLGGCGDPPEMATAAGGTHPTGIHSCLIYWLSLMHWCWSGIEVYYHLMDQISVDIALYFLYPDDYSIFDTPNNDTARAVSLLVPQRTGFTFGVRACLDARLLFSNLHVRTELRNCWKWFSEKSHNFHVQETQLSWIKIL